MNSKQSILSTLSCLLFFCLVTNASAGAPLKCEKRISPVRSKISVEAEGLTPGVIYIVDVVSGLNTASVTATADLFGDLEVDLDSNLNDQLAGATPIFSGFINGTASAPGTVLGSVTRQQGGVFVRTLAAVACKTK
jgi:hypothetical protein